MIKKIEWEEFRSIGALWWVNRILHLFGLAIVCDYDNGKLKDVYPVKCKFRGFDAESEQEGFKAVTKYLAQNSVDLIKDLDQ